MRYSIEPRERKYVERYGFLLFAKSTAKKFGNTYGKKIMDTATKTGIDAATTASKWVVQKTTEFDLIGNKIPDKITSAGKSKKDTTEWWGK